MYLYMYCLDGWIIGGSHSRIPHHNINYILIVLEIKFSLTKIEKWSSSPEQFVVSLKTEHEKIKLNKITIEKKNG